MTRLDLPREQPQLHPLDLQRQRLGIHPALRQSPRQEPQSRLRRALPHVVHFLARLVDAPHRADAPGDVIPEQVRHQLALAEIPGGGDDQVCWQGAAVAQLHPVRLERFDLRVWCTKVPVPSAIIVQRCAYARSNDQLLWMQDALASFGYAQLYRLAHGPFWG